MAARMPLVAVALIAVLLLPSCGESSLRRPDCSVEALDTLVVVAQSVPSAELVPCLEGLPPGWDFLDLDVDQEGTTMVLSSDRGGAHALTVRFDRICRTAGATRTPSDEAGARRFERVHSVSPTYSGVRYYDFQGGCVRYEFDLETDRASTLLNEASLMMGFTTREELRRRVEVMTDGRIADAP